jgi:hypothetical protein
MCSSHCSHTRVFRRFRTIFFFIIREKCVFLSFFLQLISHYDIVDINKLSSSLMIQFIVGPLNVPFTTTTNMRRHTRAKEQGKENSGHEVIKLSSHFSPSHDSFRRDDVDSNKWNEIANRRMFFHISARQPAPYREPKERGNCVRVGNKVFSPSPSFSSIVLCGGQICELRAQIMLVLNYIHIFLLSFLPHLHIHCDFEKVTSNIFLSLE